MGNTFLLKNQPESVERITTMAKIHLMNVSHTTKPRKVGFEFGGECIIVCVLDIKLR